MEDLQIKYEEAVDRCDLLEKYVEELALIIMKSGLDDSKKQLAEQYYRALVRT